MLVVFLLVFILGTLFAYISQRGDNSIRRFPLILSFLSLLLPIVYTDSGVDYYNYITIIHGLEWDNYVNFSSSETGFNLVSLVIRDFFGGNEHMCLVVFKTLTLGLFYCSLSLIKKQVKIWHSVATYLILFYLPSFYLISICLTASISFFAFMLYYCTDVRRKKEIALALIFSAGLLHNSSFIFLPVFALSLAYDGAFGRVLYLKNKASVAVGAIVLALASSAILQFSSSNFDSFHYDGYATNDFEGSGLMAFVKYGLLFSLYAMSQNQTSDKRIITWIYIYSIFSCLFFVLSYKFKVIERMEFYTMAEYIYFFPVLFYGINSCENKKTAGLLKTVYMLYLLWIGYRVVSGRTGEAVDMNIYRLFNPFIQ